MSSLAQHSTGPVLPSFQDLQDPLEDTLKFLRLEFERMGDVHIRSLSFRGRLPEMLKYLLVHAKGSLAVVLEFR